MDGWWVLIIELIFHLFALISIFYYKYYAVLLVMKGCELHVADVGSSPWCGTASKAKAGESKSRWHDEL